MLREQSGLDVSLSVEAALAAAVLCLTLACCSVLAVKDGRGRPDPRPGIGRVDEGKVQRRKTNTTKHICVFTSRGVTVCERERERKRERQ